MTLLNRVGRLLTADLHAVLDRLEEPQAQLQQALREMHQAVDSLQQEQQQRASHMAGLAQQQRQLQARHEATQDELELCLNAAQENLARTAMRRRLQLERNLATVKQQLNDGQQQLEKLNATLATQQQQLQELTGQADLASQIAATQVPTSTDWAATGQPVSEVDIDIALLAEQQKRRPT